MTRSTHNPAAPTASGGGAKTVLMLIISWTLVGLPAAWGVTQTVKKSLPLFRVTAAANHPATQPAPHG